MRQGASGLLLRPPARHLLALPALPCQPASLPCRAHLPAHPSPVCLPYSLPQASEEGVGAALRRMPPAILLEAGLQEWLEEEEQRQRQQGVQREEEGGGGSPSDSTSGSHALPAVSNLWGHTLYASILGQCLLGQGQLVLRGRDSAPRAGLQECQLLARIAGLQTRPPGAAAPPLGCRLAAGVDAHLAGCGQLDASSMLHGSVFAIAHLALGRQPAVPSKGEWRLVL